MARSCLSIVLAAGEGTRIGGSLPKVLHQVANLPMVCHVLKSLAELKDTDIVVVLGGKAELIKETIDRFVSTNGSDIFKGCNISYVVQESRLGTAHAVLAAKEFLSKRYDDVIVCFGDTPLIKSEDLNRARSILADGINLVNLGFVTAKPFGYGRFVMEGDNLTKIVEEKEATESEKNINFCNGGIMAIDGNIALYILNKVDNNNSQKEYYLTDIVKIANDMNYKVKAIEVSEDSVLGVNTPEQLSNIENIWQDNRRKNLLNQFVFMQDPKTIYFSYDTKIEEFVFLATNIYFAPGCYVHRGAKIFSFCHIEGAEIKDGSVVGPFVRLRPGSILETNSKVGNFCEIKNSSIGSNSKVNHLSYIGDSYIGNDSNIGAGVVTCNYNGINKSKTIILDNAFVGSNSSLVAPVIIGKGSYIASSSVITRDVPDGALAIGRGKQVNKDGYAAIIKQKIKDKAKQ